MSSSVPFFKMATGRRPWDPRSETQVQLSAVHMACVWHPACSVAASTLLGPQEVEPFPGKLHSLGLEARQEEQEVLRGIPREA